MEPFFRFMSALFARKILSSALVVGTLLITGFIASPFHFPRGTVLTVPEGTTVQEVGDLLEEENIIRSSLFFVSLVRLFGGERGVASGVYSFERPLSVFYAAYRLNRGETGLPFVKVTIPEGATVRTMALTLNDQLPGFNSEKFLELAKPFEGLLFPETYVFTPGVSPETVIQAMRDEFEKNIASLQGDIDAFGKPLLDVVIMASLLEKEARLYETKQTVAGILWKRIALDMPLQVDAVFGYILNTDTFSPTFDQLDIDSPYNTYLNRGLPPGPIASPGLDSLRAAVNIIETPYLFYLTGKDGTMHYAKTFDEHVANRRFLR